MPPLLPSYLVRMLRNEGGKYLKKIGFSILAAFCTEFPDMQMSSVTSCTCNEGDFACWPTWRIGNFLNFVSQITRHFYQITSQMRWHPLDTDKTYIQ